METSYKKVYIIAVVIILMVLTLTIIAGKYIEDSYKSQWESTPETVHSYNKSNPPPVIAQQIIDLKEKIIKLDTMAKQSPSKLAIIEDQKKIIRAHIAALENTH